MRRIDPGLRGLAAAVVLCASPGASAAMAESARVPHDAAVILRITSDGPSLAAKVDEALRQQLLRVRTGWSEPVIYGQTLGSATGNNPQEEQRLGDFLAATYAPRDLRLVLTSGDEALAFVLRQRDRLFPGVPVVFHGADRQAWPGALPPGVTGVFSASTDALRPTVEAAMRLHRGLERVYAVGDAAHEKALRKALSGLSGVEVVYLVGIPTTELLRRLGDLADRSVVCLGRATIDRDGRPADLQDVLPALSEMSRVPIYSTLAAHVGRGAVGGVVVPEESTVERVVPLALRVLHGDRGVAPTADAAPVPTFDERQLDRWDVPTGRLPPGSRVLFRSEGLWRRHWFLVLLAGAVVLAQSALIVALRGRRYRLEQKCDALQRATDAAGLGLWTLDTTSGRLHGTARTRSLFGGEGPGAQGLDVTGFLERIHPEDRDEVRAGLVRALAEGRQHEAAYRVLLPDGEVRWLESRGRVLAGSPATMQGVVFAVAARHLDGRQREERPQASEGRRPASEDGAGREVRAVARAWYATLTPGERGVFAGLVHGESEEQIARRIGAAVRTVRKVRAKILEKLGALSAADLVRLAELLEGVPLDDLTEGDGRA